MREKILKILERLGLYGVLFICVLLFLFFKIFFQTPSNFKPDSTIRVESGQSVQSVARELYNNGIISSPFWLTNLVIFMGGEHKVVAGYYLFQHSNSLFEVARRINQGDYGIVTIKVTLPEGVSVKEMANIYKNRFNLFDKEEFLNLATDKEGYLFPETYFFIPTVPPAEVISMMRNTFDQKINTLSGAVASSTHSVDEIITMASILEGEAKTSADRKIVAGILWKRITDGTPLQVDATFKYINGKSSAELTAADLKINSPYNTYRHRGLPPTPISNPGLDTITAALYPTDTPFYYFISDKSGNMHYATTLKEHIANVKKYL